MKAIVCTKYGPPEVLQFMDVKKPVPKDNEVLIKIYASTVTWGDIRLRSFTFARWFWLPGRIMYGFIKPRKKIPGNELSGVIESTGKNVTQFKKGDPVFGIVWEISFGQSNAEYICLPEKSIAIKPANITFEEAAAIPIGGLTAMVLLRKGKIKSGQKVLVLGASGSVGTFAVQLARHFGAEVTGVCSTSNVEWVKSLGASKVIDYTKEDFTKNDQTYDIIFDAVMKTSFRQCKILLKKKGTFITVDFPILQSLWNSIVSSNKIVYGIATKIQDLYFLRKLIEAGEIKTVIDKQYPLEKTAEAHRYVEKGHKKGNVIITMGHINKV